jgi:rhodanese-related sulfurtransferase
VNVFLLFTVIGIAVLGLFLVSWIRSARRRDLDRHSITPEELHGLLASNHEVLLFDVRKPIDLLAHAEIIPGAKRIAPQELLEDPSLIPKDKDSIVYCTCLHQKTSRAVLRRAREAGLTRVRFLQGGFAAWKENGYPVEPYDQPFRLETAS